MIHIPNRIVTKKTTLKKMFVHVCACVYHKKERERERGGGGGSNSAINGKYTTEAATRKPNQISLNDWTQNTSQ